MRVNGKYESTQASPFRGFAHVFHFDHDFFTLRRVDLADESDGSYG